MSSLAARVLWVAVAVSIAACGAATSVSDTPTVSARIMSFNIRLDVASDGRDAWPNRVSAVAATIRQADVIGVQEATPAMLDVLEGEIPAFGRFGVGRDADGGGEQSAIFYRTDRLEVVEGGTFWLSPTPEVPGSQGWDAALPRIATWARLRDRATSRTLTVVNTHFDHVGAVARRESAALLAQRAPAIAGGGPLVVMGDLNATEDSAPYRALAAVLEDARCVSESPATGSAATWNAFGRATRDQRIDHLFVRGARVLEAATLDRTIDDVLGTGNTGFPSDHHAVTATVAF